MNDIKFMPLKNGGFTIVDADLFEHYNQFVWYEGPTGYMVRYTNTPSQPRRHLHLHREILPLEKGLCVDHINGFRFDNTKRNLRAATKSQNGLNRPKMRNSRLRYKGVSYHPGYWRARLVVNGKQIVKYFKTEIAAKKGYDELVKLHCGEFARIEPDNHVTAYPE